MPKLLESVIEIGSTGIRLVVCQKSPQGEWTVVDKSELAVSLGWDVLLPVLLADKLFFNVLKFFLDLKSNLLVGELVPTKQA